MIHNSQSLETQPKSNPPASVKAASLCDSPAPLISLLSESKGDSSAYFPHSLVPDQSPDAFVVSSPHGMKRVLQLNKWATNPSPLLPLNIEANVTSLNQQGSHYHCYFISFSWIGKTINTSSSRLTCWTTNQSTCEWKETIPVVLQFRSNDSNITQLYDWWWCWILDCSIKY
jgi:hypothetical protein